jgi:hypothetical protein
MFGELVCNPVPNLACDLPAVLAIHLTKHACAIGLNGILMSPMLMHYHTAPECCAWFAGIRQSPFQKPASVHTHGRLLHSSGTPWLANTLAQLMAPLQTAGRFLCGTFCRYL